MVDNTSGETTPLYDGRLNTPLGNRHEYRIEEDNVMDGFMADPVPLPSSHGRTKKESLFLPALPSESGNDHTEIVDPKKLARLPPLSLRPPKHEKQVQGRSIQDHGMKDLVDRVKDTVLQQQLHATLYDVPISIHSIESFLHLYSGNTFQLLRATTPNLQPDRNIVVLSNEGYKSIPMTAKTKIVIFIRFQQARFDIGHWVVVRVDLISKTLHYIDSVSKLLNGDWCGKTCKEVKNLLEKALEHKSLGAIEGNFKCIYHEVGPQSRELSITTLYPHNCILPHATQDTVQSPY